MAGDCLFCRPGVFKATRIFENQNFWLVASVGQIMDDGGSVLVIPRAHGECIATLSSVRAIALRNLRGKVREALQREYKGPVTMFEHGIVGQTVQHAHLHIWPAALDLTSRVRADFPRAEIEELRYCTHLQALYEERQQPYLLWTDLQGREMVCWDPPNPPARPQYFRIIAAEFLGRSQYADWRGADPGRDQRLVRETIARLSPYFR